MGGKRRELRVGNKAKVEAMYLYTQVRVRVEGRGRVEGRARVE